MRRADIPPNTLIAQLRERKSYLSTTEVLAILGCTRNTLCGWVRAGKLSATRLPDNRYVFDPVVLAQWLSSRTS
jgi:hypothetical protein